MRIGCLCIQSDDARRLSRVVLEPGAEMAHDSRPTMKDSRSDPFPKTGRHVWNLGPMMRQATGWAINSSPYI